VRQLKGLQDIIPYTSVHWDMGAKGWRFATPEDNDAPGANVTADPVNGHKLLRDVYFGVDPEYKGRFTVPTLYDVKKGRIVSNESSEIIRMFYTEVFTPSPAISKTREPKADVLICEVGSSMI